MTRQRIFRKIGIVGAVILLPAWFYWGYLESVYVTWPTQPQPEIRRTVPYVVEGVEVYITPVCTENLSSGAVVMKSAQDGAWTDHTGPLNRARNRRILVQGSMRSDA
jgi:hypothetical protein